MNAETIENALAAELEPMRKVRFAIMGEFSAGKSTLANLLIGAPSLPVKVTATQLPPVWISEGQDAPYRVALDGTETPVQLHELSDISVADTQCIRVFHESVVLELCDLIDMPGINDPNMASEVWERIAHLADAVIWCTHATQAWRQSEAAVWENFPPELYGQSLLLLTRFDKITSERDRKRVVARVKRETEGLFRAVLPISLTSAIEADEDFEAWKASGADAFAVELVDAADRLAARLAGGPTEDEAQFEPVPDAPPLSVVETAVDEPKPDTSNVLHLAPARRSHTGAFPRRVRLTDATETARPPRKAANSLSF